MPCVTLRSNTEWVETVDGGWNTLVDLDGERVLATLEQPSRKERPPLYGEGKAAEHCVEAIGARRPGLSPERFARQDRRRRPRLLGAQPGAQLRRARRVRAEVAVRRLRGRPPSSRAFPRARATADLDELLADRARCGRARHARPDPRRACQRVARADKHCFVEKPLATTVADARRAVDAAEERRADPDGGPPARVPPGGRPA